MNAGLKRAGLIGLGFALILISAGLGLFFLATALFAWLSTAAGSGWAGLVTGVLLLAPAIGVAIWYYLSRRAEQRQAVLRAELAPLQTEEHAPLLGIALGALGAMLRAKPVTTAALAAAAGALALRHPRAAAALARRLFRPAH